MIACVIGISYYYNFFYFGGTSFSNTSLTVSPSFPFPCSDVIFIFFCNVLFFFNVNPNYTRKRKKKCSHQLRTMYLLYEARK